MFGKNKKLTEQLNSEKKAKEELKKRMQKVTSIMKVNKQVLARLGYSDSIHSSHDGKRDYTNIFGYAKEPQYSDFVESYERGDIASRIIDAPVSAVWSSQPRVVEKNTEKEQDNKFNKKWEKLSKELNLFHYIRRADKLNRLGRFSILYLGFSGNTDLSKAVSKGNKLAYVRAYGENSVQIAEYESNIYNPRYGKPLYYNIQHREENAIGSKTETDTKGTLQWTKVHYTRVIHITEDNLDSEIYSIPALQKVYNRLTDVTKVVGGSAEMFWRGARPGYAAIAESDARFSDEDREAMEEQLEDYDNDLNRWLQLQGVKIESLNQQVYSPKEHFSVLTACIASAVGIPQRILIGAESGELASSMDQRTWNSRILERRRDFAEPNILDQIVTRLQDVNELPKVEYVYLWDDLDTLTETDKAEVAYKNSIATFNFFSNEAAIEVVGAEIFGRNIMQLPESVVQEMIRREKKYLKSVGDRKKAELDSMKTPTEPTQETKEPKEKEGNDDTK